MKRTMIIRYGRPFGGALVSALLMVVGLLVGAGAIIGLNIAGIDVVGMFMPKDGAKESENKDGEAQKSNTPDEELAQLIKELRQARERQLKGDLGSELRRIQLERKALDDLKARIDTSKTGLEKKFSDVELNIKQKLEALEKKQADAGVEADASRAANLQAFADAIAKMQPSDAAAKLEGINSDQAARILFVMPRTKLSKVLQALDTSKFPEIMEKFIKLQKSPGVEGAQPTTEGEL